MTDTDVMPFTRRVTELVLARGKTPDDIAIRGCFTLLRDLALDEVLRAAEWSAKHDPWFPDPVKIRKAIIPSRMNAARASTTPESAAALAAGEVWCQTCQDTGWAYVEKATWRVLSSPPCGSHADFVVRPCTCRPMNPLYRAKRDRMPRRTASGMERE